MEVTKVKEAARLLEQYEKLGEFLRQVPEDPESMTITMRKGKATKSLTVRNDPNMLDVVKFARDLQSKTSTEMLRLGVEF